MPAVIAVGQAPGLFLYAYLGTLGQLGLNLFRGKTHPHPIEYVIWGLGLLTSILLVMVLGRIAFGTFGAPTCGKVPDSSHELA